MLLLQERRAFEGHRAADMDVRGLDVGLREAEEGEQLEGGIVELLRRHLERLRQEILAEGPFVEHELDVEGALQALRRRLDLLVRKALRAQRDRVDRRRLVEGAVADRVGLDLGDLRFAIAEGAQGVRHGAVDDLEIAAAGELLELHEREVRLDAGGVAIHHEADRAGRRDHRRLRIAVAVALAEVEGPVPNRFRVRDERGVRAGGVIEGNRVDAQALVALDEAVRGAAMVADDAQHRLGVRLVGGKGPSSRAISAEVA